MRQLPANLQDELSLWVKADCCACCCWLTVAMLLVVGCWCCCYLHILLALVVSCLWELTGRIAPVFCRTTGSTASQYCTCTVHDFDLFPSCSFLLPFLIMFIVSTAHYGEWANFSPPTIQISTSSEPEGTTASQMGMENTFHRNLHHIFHLCRTFSQITTRLSSWCCRPWIRGRFRPHLPLRVNKIATPYLVHSPDWENKTASLRTAAISYPNGTIVNVAKIDASASYQEVLTRLSLGSSRHLQYC